MTLVNRGTEAMSSLQVRAFVGKDTAGGDPLAVRHVTRLEPGERRLVVVPFALSSPALGRYTVSGRVFAADGTRDFAAPTANDPWALELMIPLTLLVVARGVRRRERARVAAGVVADPLQGSSPDVGVIDAGRSRAPVYDPVASAPALVPNGHPTGNGSRQTPVTAYATQT